LRGRARVHHRSSALAAKKTTESIPIVMATSADPARFGIVSSLARSGGNVTGLSTIAGSSILGIRSRTTYIVPGLSANYRSPDVLYGFSGEGRASYEAYEAVDGGKVHVRSSRSADGL
jgi:putative ABC transport system substrate-binding protein